MGCGGRGNFVYLRAAMSMIKKLLMIAVGAFCCASAAAQYPFIFRNDGSFNRIDLADEVVLRHRISAADSALTLGSEEIPLGAIDYIDFRQTDIPTLRFTLPEHPDYDWAKDKTTYLDAVLDIDGCGMVDDAEGLQLMVRGRGNTSWSMRKKPLRLKFEKKTAICGLQKAKSYVLLANYLDHTHMRNAAGLWVARRLGMDYAVNAVPCNVYFNGKYCGLYLLTDKIGTTKASVDIDENTGILFEASAEFDEKYKFKSSMKLPIMVKDPDFDKLYAADSTGMTPDERLAMWADDLNKAEEKVAEDKGYEAFDMASAADYFLTMNFCNNSEIGYPKSVYFYKRDLSPESLYHFGPVWDLDVAFNIVTSLETLEEVNSTTPLWRMWYFFYFEDLEIYNTLYAQRLEEFATTMYPELCEWLNDYAKMIEPSARLDGLRWPENTGVGGWTRRISSFDTARFGSNFFKWINARMEFMLSEAGLDIPFTPGIFDYELPKPATSNKSLNIHDFSGHIKSFKLNDGLEVKLSDGRLEVAGDGADYSCALADVSRIDYSEAEQTAIAAPALSDSRIEIYGDYAIVATEAESRVDIIDLSGRRVFSDDTSADELRIDLSTLADGIYILNINGSACKKFRRINR